MRNLSTIVASRTLKGMADELIDPPRGMLWQLLTLLSVNRILEFVSAYLCGIGRKIIRTGVDGRMPL